MAWIPSHQELRDHPKTRRAARLAGVSIPTMIGHLHLLWHWTLDHAPDGDLGRFDAFDLADAAMWDGEPDVLVNALVGCGPGDTSGFLEADHKLHDWSEFGGRYTRQVEQRRAAARKRWDTPKDATALRPQSDRNAKPMRASCGGDAEESRGEVEKISPLKSVGEKRATAPPEALEITASMRTWATTQGIRLDVLAAETENFLDHHRAKGTRHKDWTAAWRTWMRRAKGYRPEITKPLDDFGPNEVYR